MNMLWQTGLIMLLGGPLGFALARIAIRLQQAPSLAALFSTLILWQMIALLDQGALLATSVMLLTGVSAVLVFAQWLHREGVASRLARWGLPVLALCGLALAARGPAPDLAQALLFCAGYGVAWGAAWCAIFWARHPVAMGESGLAALGFLGAWLLVRIGVSMIAAMA